MVNRGLTLSGRLAGPVRPVRGLGHLGTGSGLAGLYGAACEPQSL
jgi:hypothetical protein